MRVAFLHNEFAEDPAYDPAVEVPPGMPVAEALERGGMTWSGSPARSTCRPSNASWKMPPPTSSSTTSSRSAGAICSRAPRRPAAGSDRSSVHWLSRGTRWWRRRASSRPSGVSSPPACPRRPGTRAGAGDQGTRWPDEDAPIRHIIKAVNEHASFKLTDDSVLASGDEDTLMEAIGEREATHGNRHFAERFVPGREFNLSLLGVAEGGRAGGPAARGDQVPRLSVGQAAHRRPRRHKWAEGSFEYRATPRSFDHAAEDAPAPADARRSRPRDVAPLRAGR